MADMRATLSRRKNRAGGRQPPPVRGFLSSLPRAGAPLILYTPAADGSVARLVTSLVQRVLSDGDGTLFVETRQSLYRVVLDEPISSLQPPSRMYVSFDGDELTVAPHAPCDGDAEDVESND